MSSSWPNMKSSLIWYVGVTQGEIKQPSIGMSNSWPNMKSSLISYVGVTQGEIKQPSIGMSNSWPNMKSSLIWYVGVTQGEIKQPFHSLGFVVVETAHDNRCLAVPIWTELPVFCQGSCYSTCWKVLWLSEPSSQPVGVSLVRTNLCPCFWSFNFVLKGSFCAERKIFENKF